MTEEKLPRAVNLADYEDALRAVIPGARVQNDGRGGLTVQWSIRVGLGIDRATSPDHAEAVMRTYGEQIRARAIRDLGVEPILAGYRAEIAEQTAAARSAQWKVAVRDDYIAELKSLLSEAVEL